MTKSSSTPERARHVVYILECADGSYYTGYTTDVTRRVAEHNGERGALGARYTRARRPVRLVYTESYCSRSEAQQREASIKKLRRAEKIELVGGKTRVVGAST